MMKDKRIILGVTGSIACYKAVEVASKLTQLGVEVDVILTEAAERFIKSLSFSSVTGRRTYVDLWESDDHVRHVNLAERAELFLIAPATAHTMAKIALGLADNLLTVTALACRCPIVIAPAMDVGMYDNPATQLNVATLKDRGVQFIGPVEGHLASGLSGLGRMAEPSELVAMTRYILGQQGPLTGRKVLVTAGPTREALDPVRYFTNYSSGKQGYALAQAALDAGAKVTLISGPVDLRAPVGAVHRGVKSANEMCEAVLDEIGDSDVLLMAAAVADFRPGEIAKRKIKKIQTGATGLELSLISNPDILEQVQAQREISGRPLITLGFAAETEDLLLHAREKMLRKSLDFIAVNQVGLPDRGFAVDENQVTLMGADGSLNDFPLQDKNSIAQGILQAVINALSARSGEYESG